jgi:hypothetical protein
MGTPLFAEQNGGIGPFASVAERSAVEVGDVIQYANASGDWYHTVLITGFDGDEILVSAQSDNARNRPLSSYQNAVEYRFSHMEGVRIEIDDDLCYRTLLAGELPFPTPDR